MANPSSDAGKQPDLHDEPASHLDIPPDRRALNKAYVATLAATARRVALEVPFGADVDDFRRVLAANAKL
jgi:hypothetical protein